jgi:hypothetical protein
VAEWLKPEEAILLANGSGGNHNGNGDGDDNGGPGKRDGILRVQAADDTATRRTVEEPPSVSPLAVRPLTGPDAGGVEPPIPATTSRPRQEP